MAKVGGSKLHQALSQEDADSVAMLGSVRFCDGICSRLIWSKIQFTLTH